jgi:hypothetical protein
MKELTPDEHKILVDAIQDSATVVHKGQKDMNERIRELAEQVYGSAHYDDFKFAELIVRECLSQVDKMEAVLEDDKEKTGVAWVGLAIAKHFGVE